MKLHRNFPAFSFTALIRINPCLFPHFLNKPPFPE